MKPGFYHGADRVTHRLGRKTMIAPLILLPALSLALASGTALAQTAPASGYAPAFPPGYMAPPPPGAGATPAPVVATPMAAPTASANAGASDTPNPAELKYIAKPLTTPALPADSPPEAYLRAAQAALATGHDGEAQQAMEMAQTRLLDRSVPLGQTGIPSANPAVDGISAALTRLTAGDRSGAMQKLDAVLAQLGKH